MVGNIYNFLSFLSYWSWENIPSLPLSIFWICFCSCCRPVIIWGSSSLPIDIEIPPEGKIPRLALLEKNFTVIFPSECRTGRNWRFPLLKTVVKNISQYASKCISVHLELWWVSLGISLVISSCKVSTISLLKSSSPFTSSLLSQRVSLRIEGLKFWPPYLAVFSFFKNISHPFSALNNFLRRSLLITIAPQL